ncbi:MAG: sigma-70 family RNA polymerase sigma factor, partial [Acidimicrobiia bacterium]|nr:sigma-70 family RNA polymerase sigma factor [Acidimicrobiia bacterium]
MTESVPLTWEEVARVYGRKIYNFAYRLTGDPNEAADLVQEVLLRVRKGLANYQPGSFEGWLWRITRNAFLDDVRKRNRRLTSPLPDEIDRWELAHVPGADVEYSRINLGD